MLANYSAMCCVGVVQDKPLKMPLDSISESLIFLIFLGACPQTPRFAYLTKYTLIVLQCACCLEIVEVTNH